MSYTRGDGKDVTARQIAALCQYCQFELRPLFEDSTGAGLVSRSKEEVMSAMTREKYGRFFEDYRQNQALEDSSWLTEKSPYEM